MTLEDFWHGVKRSKQPLVGLEYIIHIVNSQNSFACMLCLRDIFMQPKRGTSFNIIQHIKAKSHQKRFLQVEYPTVYDKLLKFQQDEPGEQKLK